MILKILMGVVGGALIGIGNCVSLIQIAIGAENRKRPLTEKEVAMLTQVFRNSVALFKIRIIEGKSGVFDFNDRAFTMGNTIYMKRTSAARWDRTLVHETTHVWQYQNAGPRYASQALGAQVYYEYVKGRSAYDWWDPEVVDVNSAWEDWNPEAAAQFIEDLYSESQLSL